MLHHAGVEPATSALGVLRAAIAPEMRFTIVSRANIRYMKAAILFIRNKGCKMLMIVGCNRRSDALPIEGGNESIGSTTYRKMIMKNETR